MTTSKYNDLLSTYAMIISKRTNERLSDKEKLREIYFAKKRQLRTALYEILGDYDAAVLTSCESIHIDVTEIAKHTHGTIRIRRGDKYASIVIEIDEEGIKWRTMDRVISWKRSSRDDLIIFFAYALYQDYERYNALAEAQEYAINSSQEE